MSVSEIVSVMRYAINIMHTRRYFLLALVLPLLIVLVGVLFAGIFADPGASTISMILTPYVCFFLVLSVWCLNKPPGQIRRVAYRAPLIFLAFQLAYLAVEYMAGVSMAKDLMGLAGVLVIVATYIIIIGYLYTFIMELGYFSYLDHKRHPRSTDNSLRC